MTPSKARAPSNTLEPSQKAWVRGPMIGLLPSNHSPSRKVKVCDQAGIDLELVGTQEGGQSPFWVFQSSGTTSDASRVQTCRRLADASAADHALGRDFGERNEHEGAVEDLRMGQREPRAAESDGRHSR